MVCNGWKFFHHVDIGERVGTLINIRDKPLAIFESEAPDAFDIFFPGRAFDHFAITLTHEVIGHFGFDDHREFGAFPGLVLFGLIGEEDGKTSF